MKLREISRLPCGCRALVDDDAADAGEIFLRPCSVEHSDALERAARHAAAAAGIAFAVRPLP